MRITSIAMRVGLMVALATLAVPHAASAHTYVPVAGFQIGNGGYLHTYGVGPEQHVNDGPASDGTVIWANADPVEHTFVLKCVAGGCLSLPLNQRTISVKVPMGTATEMAKIPLGTWDYGDPAYPFMHARLRVTSGE